MYTVYEAKRISEEVGNVGRQTDMAIVSVGKPARRSTAEAIESLEEIYQSRLPLRRADKNAIRRLLGL